MPLALTILGLVLLLGLAPVAHWAASRLPRPPGDPTPVVAGATRPGSSALRSVPIGLPAHATVTTQPDVYPYAVAALGVTGANAMMAALSASEDVAPRLRSSAAADYAYPYDYAALDPILDAAPRDTLQRGALPLAAALISLVGQPRSEVSRAAPIAYAVLDRTRATGGCDTQLDLLLLLAGDPFSSTALLGAEQRRTEAACPTEPTPGWVVGQAEMRNLDLLVSARLTRTDDRTHAGLDAAIRTFQDVARRFPRDTAALTGLGDAYLRAGLRLQASQPFTARRDLRLAVATYNQAAALGAAREADLGRARALVALGEARDAVRLVTPLTEQSSRPGAALEVLLAADEAAHDFAGAETVARRIDDAGPSAYPRATAFFPAPADSDSALPSDASLPLSTGADTLAPLQDFLVPTGGAGGTVQDLSFIPQYREDPDVTGTVPSCPSLSWRRDAVLAGHGEAALATWPSQYRGARPDRVETGCAFVSNLRSIAELVANERISDSTVSRDELTDEWQNLLRWTGDLPAARTVAVTWEAKAGERTELPALRLGEIAFLQHDYHEAAAQFDAAARRARLLNYGDDLAVDQAQLNRGAALFAAGRSAEAVTVLRPLVALGTHGFAYQTTKKNSDTAASFAAVSYYAAEQLGDYESASGNLHGAVEDYRTALSWTTQLDGLGVRPEVLHDNLALAYLGLGATDDAAAEVEEALHNDPMDPAFLMTAGFVADRAGQTSAAIDYDRRALDNDPGAFPAANDLGVELARLHHDGEAVSALRQAIGANPHYALGWFNLGVLEGRRGALHLPASQGAFARAFALDATLKDRRHELTIDASIYRTALDLSKPLPPRWSLAQTQQAVPLASAGLLAVLLLALGLARSSGAGGTDLAKQWLEPWGERLDGVRGVRRLRRPAWAVAATGLAFLLAYWRHAGGLIDLVAYVLAVLTLTGTAMWMRIAVARRAHVLTTQRSWLPGMAFGVGTGALGLPWAPLPVVKTGTESARVHLAAPLVLAGLAVALFAESAWLGTPLTQSCAVAALVMAGSTLLPVDPLDGAHVGKTGVAAAAGIIGGAVLVALGII